LSLEPGGPGSDSRDPDRQNLAESREILDFFFDVRGESLLSQT
jgi:hypothetical protein